MVVQALDPRLDARLVVVNSKRQRRVVHQGARRFHGLLPVLWRALWRGFPGGLPSQPLRVVVVLCKNSARLVGKRRVAHRAPHVVAPARLLTRHAARRTLDGIRLDVCDGLYVFLLAHMVEQ
jgi:hypothetical protein